MKKGFTIIEVSLVLAIGGLIFLMVFVALPALRTSQRDTSRREDMISFIDSVKKYQTNNRGTLPGAGEAEIINNGSSVTVNGSEAQTGRENTWGGFYAKYLGENFVDPDGEKYNLSIVQCAGKEEDEDCGVTIDNPYPNNHEIKVVLRSKCYGDKTRATSNPRKLSVLYKLEGAGVYCNNT